MLLSSSQFSENKFNPTNEVVDFAVKIWACDNFSRWACSLPDNTTLEEAYYICNRSDWLTNSEEHLMFCLKSILEFVSEENFEAAKNFIKNKTMKGFDYTSPQIENSKIVATKENYAWAAFYAQEHVYYTNSKTKFGGQQVSKQFYSDQIREGMVWAEKCRNDNLLTNEFRSKNNWNSFRKKIDVLIDRRHYRCAKLNEELRKGNLKYFIYEHDELIIEGILLPWQLKNKN